MLKVRIKFRKYGFMKFIGHLDVMRYFQKAMRRAEIPIAYTGGYSPHMIMSFAQPLGVGVTSDGEYLDIELKEPISSEKAVEQLNRTMVEGMEVVSFREIPDDKKSSGMTIVAAASYRVTLLESRKTSEITMALPEEWQERVEAFMAQPEIVVMKKTKRSEKEVDIKPMIYQMKVLTGKAGQNSDSIYLFLATGSEQNLKPDLVMEAFLAFIGIEDEEVPMHYHRLEVYAKNHMSQGSDPFISLEDLGNEIR